MPDVVSPVRTIGIRMVQAPIQIALLQIAYNLIASETQQRPDKFEPIGKDALRPDAAEPAKTRAATKPLDDRLGIVIFLMCRSDSAAIVCLRDIYQSFHPQPASRRLDRQLMETGKSAHIRSPRRYGQLQFRRVGDNKLLVPVRLSRSQLMIDMSTKQLGIEKVLGLQRVHRVHKSYRISPAGNSKQDFIRREQKPVSPYKIGQFFLEFERHFFGIKKRA
jgi:hypothetical protein